MLFEPALALSYALFFLERKPDCASDRPHELQVEDWLFSRYSQDTRTRFCHPSEGQSFSILTTSSSDSDTAYIRNGTKCRFVDVEALESSEPGSHQCFNLGGVPHTIFHIPKSLGAVRIDSDAVDLT